MEKLTTDFIDERILIILSENDRSLLKKTLYKYNQDVSIDSDFDNHEYLSYDGGEKEWFTDECTYNNPDDIIFITANQLEEYLFANTLGNTFKFS